MILLSNIKFIKENQEKVKEGIENKGYKVDIDELLKVHESMVNNQLTLQVLSRQKNEANKIIPRSQGKDKENKIEEMKIVDARAKEHFKELEKSMKRYIELAENVPNLPALDVKVGKNESENEIIKTVGEKTKFDFKPKDHLEIGKSLDIIDVKRAATVSGSRFTYLKNEAVLLQFALINFAFDFLVKEGFKPILPPVMITDESMKAMGYLEHGGDDETYHFEKDQLYFVGTAEQAIGPMHQNEILNDQVLPLRYVGYSSCFRREAGSYGKDVKGILRVHQFDKVEMFCYAKPEDSNREHEYLLSLEEKIMQALEIPYQVVKMCTGDLGFPTARKYDLEAWMPGQGRYRETHSTSSCTDFQARRLNIRYKSKETGKNEFVHTLNGTATALGRTIIAILENYQQRDGSVTIPKVLQSYLKGLREIKK